MMSIWFKKDISLSAIKNAGINGLPEYLGMEWTGIGADFLALRMPVNEKTKQSYGILHGGASCALAETAGSIASALVIDTQKFACVGLEINANHIKSATNGFVTALCAPIHIGKKTHVWDIKIHNDAAELVCICRLTVIIIKRDRLSFAEDAGAFEHIGDKGK